MRIFIVDDAPELRARVRQAVAALPAAEVVGEACDAATAILGIGRTEPDVVVLDVVFPHGGGRAVLDVLRASAAPPVVLVLTNHPEPEYRDFFLRRGAAGVFDKSLEFESFVAALADLARARAAVS